MKEQIKNCLYRKHPQQTDDEIVDRIIAIMGEQVAPLVEALDYWYKRYADEDGEAMLQDDPLGDCADKGKQALANLPKELKLK